ncbi:dihydroceramidase, partial [Tremellales sp. Uapishka_1]
MGAFDGLRGDQIDYGYWGNHTSTIDWCELNYTHSPYIAEFVNTLTNVPIILLGVYGAWAHLRNGIQKRYALIYLGLSLIGVGSFGFHASLRWEWQLMDELPMIYVITYATYLVFDTLPTFAPRFGQLGVYLMLAWDVFVTLSYLYLPNPIYHQIAFAAILLSSVGRNVYLITKLPAGHPNRSKIIKTLFNGLTTFALGFVIWNIDNFFCTQLRTIREHVGVWGFLVEGHAYWHILTGYGSFLVFTSSIELTLATKVSPDAYTFDAKSWFPVVRKVEAPKLSPTSEKQSRAAEDRKQGGR